MGSIISSEESNRTVAGKIEGSEERRFGGAIEEIIDDTEELLGTVVAPDGLVYEDSDGRRQIAGPVVVAATGTRVVFVTADDRETDAGSLEYVDLASVDVERGEVTVSTTAGVRCVLAVADSGPPLAHLQWVGELRRRLVSCRNDVELGADEIRDQAKAMEWHGARDRYEELRGRLDALIDAVQRTAPVPEAAIAPELTGIERRLECAGAHLSLRRAESKRQLARQLADAEEFDQLGTVLDSAKTHYDRARSHAAALERSDGFRFGEQREVHTALAELSRDLDDLAAEPRRAASEAREAASDATDPASRIEHLETALERYREALAFGDAGDDCELAAVAADIVESRREAARVDWNEGADLARAGRAKEAIRTWRDAVDHLERAAELAEEFDHEAAEQLSGRLARVERSVESMREAAVPDGNSDGVDPVPAVEDRPGIGPPPGDDPAREGVEGTAEEPEETMIDGESLDELAAAIANGDAAEE